MSETILIVEDHPLFRQALVMAAKNVRKNAIVLDAQSISEAVKIIDETKAISLILLDLKVPGADGYSGVALIHAECPNVPILVVSAANPERAAAESKRYGAIGFISKGNELEIIERAIEDAITNKSVFETNLGDISIDKDVDTMAQKVASLTPMQLRVLLGVLSGRLNKQIAYDLGISEATVKAHLTAIFKKLDVGNRTQAVLAARALGIGDAE